MDECICGYTATGKTLDYDKLTNSRTFLRCRKCRGIVATLDDDLSTTTNTAATNTVSTTTTNTKVKKIMPDNNMKLSDREKWLLR